MKKPCKICNQSRIALVWIILFIFLGNSVYQLVSSDDGLILKDIILIPITICAIALLIKLHRSIQK